MKSLVLTAFAAASILSSPGMVLATTFETASIGCDGEVPEAWRRPGGYCDQASSTDSLIEPPTTEPETILCVVDAWQLIRLEHGMRIDVATPILCNPCGPSYGSIDTLGLPVGDRIHVAC